MARNYYIFRMSTWWNGITPAQKERLEKERGCKERFPSAVDIYKQLKLLTTGWYDLTEYSDKTVILDKHFEVYGQWTGNKRALGHLLDINSGDILLVPWSNYKQFYIFEATTSWLNYRQMADYTGIEKKAKFSKLKRSKKCSHYLENQQFTKEYFEKMDVGFFVEAKPLTSLIHNDKEFHGYISTVKRVKSKKWITWIDNKLEEYPRKS